MLLQRRAGKCADVTRHDGKRGAQVTDDELARLRDAAAMQVMIDQRIAALYAPEDEALWAAREAPAAHGMPSISVSPAQGKLLQTLARAVGARRILEIGALAGYSGIWLARALPADGRLISLEVSEKHAEVARASLARAGVADRAEVRVGPASETLPALEAEAPFDLVFIDADKVGYPLYLDWALRLARLGGFIVADNTVREGRPLAEALPEGTDEHTRGLWEYNRRVASDSRLLSIALPTDEGGLDGLTASLVVG
ncbi:MAG TPA: O-methyltransferase [Ktedonobacterales bacterium]|nr:O-methyltransferase [Ktedonobacterales bacterium]